MSLDQREFEALRPKAVLPDEEPKLRLEAFPTPKGVTRVTMTSDEVTSLCPITHQPDFETIVIEYIPRELCLESKSLKLYFFALRERGAFIEDLSSQIAHDIAEKLTPSAIKVTAKQKARGGIAIDAVTHLHLVWNDLDPDRDAIPVYETVWGHL